MRSTKNRRSRKSLLSQNADLDLKPFMNLFVVLIPFLLAFAQFSKITLIEISLPEHSDRAVAVEKKTAEEKGLNLTVIITDHSLTIGAKGGFLPYINYREFHKYVSLSDKNEFTIEYNPSFPNKPVISKTDGRKLSKQERMDINLIACNRNKPTDKGKIVKTYYNKFDELLTNVRGQLVTSLAVGDTVYSIPNRTKTIVRTLSKYKKVPLSAYDKLAVDLLLIKAKYKDMPDENNIIIAAEDEIAYDKIVQIIDVCRSVGFPNVSIAKMRG